MISSLAEFDEATAFERWALQALVPLPTARPHVSIKDINANALSQSGIGTTTRMSINQKVRAARTAAGTCPPLSADPGLWAAFASAYAATAEIRHSLVHRLAEVDQATGQLTGRDDRGQPLSPVSAADQEAFCRAAQRAAQAVLASTFSPRERSDLAWNLD